MFEMMCSIPDSMRQKTSYKVYRNWFYTTYTTFTGPKIWVRNEKLFFLFLKQNICCGYSKEPSHWDGSFEHPKHMYKLMDKKIIAILRWKILLNWPYELYVKQTYENTFFDCSGSAHRNIIYNLNKFCSLIDRC